MSGNDCFSKEQVGAAVFDAALASRSSSLRQLNYDAVVRASPINSAVRSATASAAASRTASAEWTYRDVIDRPLCPTSAAIVGSE